MDDHQNTVKDALENHELQAWEGLEQMANIFQNTGLFFTTDYNELKTSKLVLKDAIVLEEMDFFYSKCLITWNWCS